MSVSDELWKAYLKEQMSNPKTLPIDKFIIKAFEERLTGKDIGHAIKKFKHEKAEIASISFGYNNSILIKLLIERGKLISKGKIAKIKKIDD